MITIKNEIEIGHMRKAGRILAQTLDELKTLVKPGVPTSVFDEHARKKIMEEGATASFLGYKPDGQSAFPSSICISLNEEVVHGLPSNRLLQLGDIISLDLGVGVAGFHTDAAITLVVGKASAEAEKLIANTQRALEAGIFEVKEGATTGDIGAAVGEVLENSGLGVVRDLVGHGIGRSVHEDPAIPNVGSRGTGELLKAGMTICIEPMAGLGGPDVHLKNDKWTYAMSDGQLSAHFEHTILVTKTGHEILTKI